jgi:hypothetical protein
MSNKIFIERLNKELDAMGVPEPTMERASALHKLLAISQAKAESWLEGIVNLNDPALVDLAAELEVKLDWLLGKQDKK